MVVYQSGKFIEGLITNVRSLIQKAQAPPKKKKKVVGVRLTIGAEYTGWRKVALESMAAMYKENGRAFPAMDVFQNTILESMKQNEETTKMTKKDLMMLVLPFAKFMKAKVDDMGPDILSITSLIDEEAVLKDNLAYVC